MARRTNEDLAAAERDFADDFATVVFTLSPIAGRMLGLLLVTNEPHLSSRDIVERLGVSPASVSSMGRLLVQANFVDRTVSPETRRDLFSIRSDAWAGQARRSLARLKGHLAMLDQALAECPADHDRTREKLTDMRDYFGFIYEDLPLQLERYEKWRSEKGQDGAATSGA